MHPPAPAAGKLALMRWPCEEHERLVFRGHPADATAATRYRRLADETTPRAADAEGAQSHASGALHASQAAALDRLGLRYFEELRSSEEFPSCV